MSGPSGSALVLGGGLAGLSAALRLAERGVSVTLLETSRRLGGRATSHDDPQTGQTLDNCQHVLMGCCTNLLDLYQRLGVSRWIEWHDALHFFDKHGHHDALTATDLPAPLHLSGGLMRFATLSVGEKLAIGRAMLRMARMGRAGRAALERISFGDWLAEQSQPPGAVEKFWSVIIISALNQTPRRASAAAAIQVFQEGFLAHRDAYRMGTATVPLRRLYDPALERIQRAGGSVRFGGSVKRLVYENGRITGVELQNGHHLEADVCISALPFDRLQRVIAAPMRAADPRLAGLDCFSHSPILGIHLWYDRPVIRWPHMILVDSPLQWVFDKTPTLDSGRASSAGQRVDAAPGGRAGSAGQPMDTAPMGRHSGPYKVPPSHSQYLHGVISAADEWVDEPAGRIAEMAAHEIAAYAPEARHAELVRSRVIKEKKATFSIEPGIEDHRPTTTGSIENLLLAGDWTDTGWPATMEGAVRSGYKAAAAAMGEPPEAGLTEDLPPSPLYRWLDRRRASA